MSKRERAGARGVAGVVVVAAGLLALAVAIRQGRSPWFEIGLAVAGLLLVWETFKKFTSQQPVDDLWHGHIHSFLFGAVFVLGGLGAAATGGDDGTVVNRIIGVVFAVVGTVLLAAERRDFRLWRARLRQHRQNGRT